MKFANELGTRITIHFAEVKKDVEYIKHRFGMTLIDCAVSVNMLGSIVVLVHAVRINDNNIRKFAETQTHVSHNPLANTKLASGIAPVSRMINAGVNVCLGTDGGPRNNSYDMINDMRRVSYIHKVNTDDPTVMPSELVLYMATINDTKSMGLENEIGFIQVGKQADFVAIDMNKPHLTPRDNVLSTIACAGYGSDVDTVIIGGKIIMRDRHVLTMDKERILNEARMRAEQLYKRSGVKL